MNTLRVIYLRIEFNIILIHYKIFFIINYIPSYAIIRRQLLHLIILLFFSVISNWNIQFLSFIII